VKVKETVSDEAREDQWGVRFIDRYFVQFTSPTLPSLQMLNTEGG